MVEGMPELRRARVALAVSKYHGRRFASLIFISLVLTVAYFAGGEHFPTFAQTLGAMYGVYLMGQSATDWRKYGQQDS